MKNGDFYASNGVYLKSYQPGAKRYSVEVDTAKTQAALAVLPEWAGLSVTEETEGYRIEFIGSGGRTLKTIQGIKGSYRFKAAESYVRARVVFARKGKERGYEAFYAWGAASLFR
jgi:hypothetical protein